METIRLARHTTKNSVMKTTTKVATLASTLITCGSLAGGTNAALLTFIPTTDPAGSVLSKNRGDDLANRGSLYSAVLENCRLICRRINTSK